MVSGVALGLYVNSIQAEDVLPDDTVNPAVTGTAPVLSRTGPPAIAHSREQVEHKLSQEDWLLVEHALQDIGRQCLVAFPHGLDDHFEWGVVSAILGVDGICCLLAGTCPRPHAELAILLEPA